MKSNSPILQWVLRDLPAAGYVFRSVVVLGLCTAVGLVFFFLGFSEANIITIYVVGSLLIAVITGKWLYGAFSSIVGVLLFNCLFAEPRFTLLVYDPQYTITIIITLLASLATSYLMNLLRQELSKEILVTRRSEILLETSKGLQDASTPDQFNSVATAQLSNLLARPVLLFPLAAGRLQAPVGTDDTGLIARLDALTQEIGLEDWALSPTTRNMLIVDQREGGRILFFKVHTRDRVHAVVCTLLAADEDLTPFEENMIFAMLDEIALAIERHNLQQANLRIARTADEERLRTTLLRTISHDLRTPLTGILGNADILLQSGRAMDEEKRQQLYLDIREDSRWLIDLVENLLFVTRLDNGTMPVRLQPELLGDILGEALRLAAKRANGHEILTRLPEDLIMVDADARLMVQVLLNLLDNALKYSPATAPVTLSVQLEEDRVLVEVADEGPGIPATEREKVFEMFYTADNRSGDGRRGLGVGLALCQAIVTAHGGQIFIRDNAPAGTIVGVSLNRKEVPA